MNKSKGFVSKKGFVISLVSTTLVTILVTGFLGPYITAYFGSVFDPRPDVHILQEECVAIPLWGTEYVAFRAMVENKGGKQEENIVIRIELSEPFRHQQNDLPSIEENIGSIRAGETRLITCPIIAPSVDYILHSSITITVSVFGEIQVWDAFTFTESW